MCLYILFVFNVVFRFVKLKESIDFLFKSFVIIILCKFCDDIFIFFDLDYKIINKFYRIFVFLKGRELKKKRCSGKNVY